MSLTILPPSPNELIGHFTLPWIKAPLKWLECKCPRRSASLMINELLTLSGIKKFDLGRDKSIYRESNTVLDEEA